MVKCSCGNDFEPRQTGGREQQYCSARCCSRMRKQRNRDKKDVTVETFITLPYQTNVPQKKIKPPLKYPGAKWSRAQWIIGQLPTFRTYVEPYFGSGAIFFSLDAVPEYAVLNDKSKSVVNLFEMIRTRGPELCAQIELTPWARDEYDASFEQTGEPLEDARRFLVRCWQAHGTRLNGKTGWRNRGSLMEDSRTRFGIKSLTGSRP